MTTWTTTLAFLLCLLASASGAPTKNTDYADSTLVVYNQTSPESRALAAFYVKERGLSAANIVGLDCPEAETITRPVYEEKIAAPLRKFMSDNKLWTVGESPQGPMATKCKIHIVALMKGMPMRISMTPLPPTGKVDEAGKPVPPVKNQQQTDEASVDSELSFLSLTSAPTKGMGRNPYFKSGKSKAAAGIAPLLLVGRIDGPDWDIAKRLITDAIAAEQGGLWGNGYIDLARLELSKGAGYKIGDEWLRTVAKNYEQVGIPTYVDSRTERLPTNFPMGDDVILYFGWYTRTADGPFGNPEFKFKQGAVACHIHSYSATTIRSTTREWAGPLLARGAAATLGNVYEPFLTFTTNLDMFNAALLEGYTFIESAWMATPAVSWMNVMIGDPLYQPFQQARPYGKTPDPDFKATRMAVNRWRDDPELFTKLAFAADKLKSAKIYETIGLRYREKLKFDEAREAFGKARAMFTKKGDQLRMELFVIDLMRSEGKKDAAVAALREIQPNYADDSGAKTIEALINQLDPPPPPPPPPATPTKK